MSSNSPASSPISSPVSSKNNIAGSITIDNPTQPQPHETGSRTQSMKKTNSEARTPSVRPRNHTTLAPTLKQWLTYSTFFINILIWLASSTTMLLLATELIQLSFIMTIILVSISITSTLTTIGSMLYRPSRSACVDAATSIHQYKQHKLGRRAGVVDKLTTTLLIGSILATGILFVIADLMVALTLLYISMGFFVLFLFTNVANAIHDLAHKSNNVSKQQLTLFTAFCAAGFSLLIGIALCVLSPLWSASFYIGSGCIALGFLLGIYILYHHKTEFIAAARAIDQWKSDHKWIDRSIIFIQMITFAFSVAFIAADSPILLLMGIVGAINLVSFISFELAEAINDFNNKTTGYGKLWVVFRFALFTLIAIASIIFLCSEIDAELFRNTSKTALEASGDWLSTATTGSQSLSKIYQIAMFESIETVAMGIEYYDTHTHEHDDGGELMPIE